MPTRPPPAPASGARSPGAQGAPSPTDVATATMATAADATGALASVDALATAVGAAAIAAGAAAAMAAGLVMPAVANNTLLRFPAPPPPTASHLHTTRPNSALVAARAAAAEGLVRVREAAIAWERKRDASDALARQIADAEQLLGLPASPSASSAAR